MGDENAAIRLNPRGRFPLVLTCEHASCTIPDEYKNLGVEPGELRRHIGWDIGARRVVENMTKRVDSAAACSGYSRLLIDCNRDLHEHDLILAESDGTAIPGNRALSGEERQKRITRFYQPYHDAIDRLIDERLTSSSGLLSIHSFTPVLGEVERLFDIGILFDRYEELAGELGRRLGDTGLRVRANEPYSGYDGLIFSVRKHGERYGIPYLEIEINHGLIADSRGAEKMGATVGRVCLEMFSGNL